MNEKDGVPSFCYNPNIVCVLHRKVPIGPNKRMIRMVLLFHAQQSCFEERNGDKRELQKRGSDENNSKKQLQKKKPKIIDIDTKPNTMEHWALYTIHGVDHVHAPSFLGPNCHTVLVQV